MRIRPPLSEEEVGGIEVALAETSERVFASNKEALEWLKSRA